MIRGPLGACSLIAVAMALSACESPSAPPPISSTAFSTPTGIHSSSTTSEGVCAWSSVRKPDAVMSREQVSKAIGISDLAVAYTSLDTSGCVAQTTVVHCEFGPPYRTAATIGGWARSLGASRLDKAEFLAPSGVRVEEWVLRGTRRDAPVAVKAEIKSCEGDNGAVAVPSIIDKGDGLVLLAVRDGVLSADHQRALVDAAAALAS